MIRPEEQWIDDVKAESTLKELGVQFKSGKLNLADVNWKKTLENFGRTGRALNQDRVEDYALGLLEGDKFPRPIAINTKDGIVIYAGVHRTKAAVAAELKAIGVYYADPQLEHQIRMLAGVTNRKEGLGTTREEATAQAAHICQEFGLLPKDVAKRYRVNPKTVEKKISVDNVRRKCAEAGFKGSLPETVYAALFKLTKNYTVLCKAAEHIQKYKVASTECPSFTKSILVGKTESEQLAVIDKDARRRSVATNGHAPRGRMPSLRRTTFLKLFRGLLRYATTLTFEQLQVEKESDEHKELRKEWRELRSRLNKILG
jgi:hypothetical protein